MASKNDRSGDFGSKANDGHTSKLSHTEKKVRRLTDLQILQQIDSQEDPEGKQALRKIDFTSGGMSCGRKEFANKTEAMKALEQSKYRVSEILDKARN